LRPLDWSPRGGSLNVTMKRLVAIILALCFSVLGTGIVQHLHERQHAATPFQSETGHRHSGTPFQDSSHCSLCLLLHQPLMAQPFAPSLALVLTPIGCHHTAPVRKIESLRLDRQDCRGPPDRSLSV